MKKLDFVHIVLKTYEFLYLSNTAVLTCTSLKGV